METAHARTFYWMILGGIALLMAGGCDEVALNLSRPSNGPLRPVGQPMAAATAPAPQAGAPTHQTGNQPLNYHQVILHNEPAPADTPAGIHYVRLVHAAAGDVGPLLSHLFIPSGPLGSQKRYCLVYPSKPEAEAAASLAPALDISPPIDADAGAIPAEPRAAFNYGVALLYGRVPGQSPDAQRVRRAEAALSRVENDTRLAQELRWAAGMIAAWITSEYLYDYEAADRHFAAAELQAKAGSLEQMSTWYARACAQFQNGRVVPARQLLARLVAQFGAYRDSEAFARADRILREPARKH